jgi:hypothetical protein
MIASNLDVDHPMKIQLPLARAALVAIMYLVSESDTDANPHLL